MRKSYITLQPTEFKQRFSRFVQHKKKVKALENLSVVANFRHTKYLSLLKDCLEDGFLEDKEEEFLEWMLKKYEINYLEWSHKTKWLKEKMDKIARQNHKVEAPQQVQLCLEFGKSQAAQSGKTAHVPYHLLAQQQRQSARGA